MKCEPSAYSIDDLARDGETCWEGVRNFQARNFMRNDMRVGDEVLFYASNAAPPPASPGSPGSRGPPIRTTSRGRRATSTSTRAASRDAPIWYMVDLEFVERFAETVPLSVLKTTQGLEAMKVTQKGSRLSVQPVTRAEYDIVVRLGRPTGGG